MARLSFSFPFVKPPNMIPNVDESILWTEFGPDRDQVNIPQPWPLWIKNISEKDFLNPTSSSSKASSTLNKKDKQTKSKATAAKGAKKHQKKQIVDPTLTAF